MKKKTKYLPVLTMCFVLTLGILICPTVFAEGIDPIALPDGGNIVSWLLAVASNILIVFLIFVIFRTLFNQRWGLFVILLLGGALAAWIIYFTDSFVGVLKAIASAFSG